MSDTTHVLPFGINSYWVTLLEENKVEVRRGLVHGSRGVWLCSEHSGGKCDHIEAASEYKNNKEAGKKTH